MVPSDNKRSRRLLSLHYIPFSMGIKSCVKKEEKTFPLCPLCELNDVIYDCEGGNVLRGHLKKTDTG